MTSCHMMPRPDDGNALRGVALPTQTTSFLTMPVTSISFISKHVCYILGLANIGLFFVETMVPSQVSYVTTLSPMVLRSARADS